MYEISGQNCLEAWKKASHLVCEGDIFNLLTTIEDPVHMESDWLRQYDPRNLNPGNKPNLSDVVNTIFPMKLANHLDRTTFYDRYLNLHSRTSRLGKKKKRHWGTYFERMISFGEGNINQLEKIICVLENEQRWFKVTNPIHISSAEYDPLSKRMGNPCLQYVQFIQMTKGEISLVALYRNQDFFNKALGNFIGLGQLLSFVASSANKEVGKLICHSVHAYSESTSNLKRLAEFD